jgi:protein-S-isoprenylcysteine O-methyltransferase Ste14
MVLLGEYMAILSMEIFKWMILFFLINYLYFVLYEEPNLEKRFGKDYRDYKKKVRRWIPRLKPYKPPQNEASE